MNTLPPLSPEPMEIVLSALALLDVALLLVVAVLVVAVRPPMRLGLSEVLILLLVPVVGPALIIRRHMRGRRKAAI